MSGYIGNIPVPQSTQTRDNFTATSGQTTFSTSGYTPNYLDVYLNGVHLDPSDYTATNGTDVVLGTGATAGDIVSVVAFSTFETVDQDFSGDFSVDGSTFVVDSTNNRVGVGTSSPSHKLEVNGSININDGSADGAQLVLSSAGNSDWNIDNYSGDFRLYNGSTERMRIDSNGNVGIGTNNPTSRLHTIGDSNVVTNTSNGSTFTLELTPSTTSGKAGIGFRSRTQGAGGSVAGLYSVEDTLYRDKLVARYNADGSVGAFVVEQMHPAGQTVYERMRIDSSGRVTMPYQPAFSARLSGNATVGGNGVVPFDITIFNRGSHYSTSTNRFTAPVDGVYHFAFNVLSQSGGFSGALDMRFYVNGARREGATTYMQDYTGTHDHAHTSGLIELVAGDYVEVKQINTVSIPLNGTHTVFSGHLVG